ncbi:Cytochrome c domain-containing protein [Aphelenchoides besseyi]|nr:Cytochrome c domain-containing protein [Aphelenchoides besseyi]
MSSRMTGSTLNGVIGRQSGQVLRFKYSAPILKKNVLWTQETLSVFLRDPKMYVPETKMMFDGLKKKKCANFIKFISNDRSTPNTHKHLHPELRSRK